jgi:hypothetical protein
VIPSATTAELSVEATGIPTPFGLGGNISLSGNGGDIPLDIINGVVGVGSDINGLVSVGDGVDGGGGG